MVRSSISYSTSTTRAVRHGLHIDVVNDPRNDAEKKQDDANHDLAKSLKTTNLANLVAAAMWTNSAAGRGDDALNL